MPELSSYIHNRMGGKLTDNQIAPYVVMPGSQNRIQKIIRHWDEYHMLAEHYEFHVYSGLLNGQEITACSTGIGGRSTSIAVDEMAALGAHTFIRVGVTGGIQEHMQVGDLVIATGAVRLDRTSEHYVFKEYPAVADAEVICALISAAESLGCTYHTGIVATVSSFYAGQGITCHNGYRNSRMDTIETDLKNANVYDWDSETATILTLSNLYGLRAGRINVVVDDPDTGIYNPIGEEMAVNVTIKAMETLMEWDKLKKQTGQQVILPSLPSEHHER
mgnify:FL=1|tara:strand:- start:205 stop:1032 length:828 start_codon:yes stop_codon:yes gene_type:complete